MIVLCDKEWQQRILTEMTCMMDAKRENVEHIIEEQQAYRVQVTAFSQMHLQAMQMVEEQEKEL